jgi:NAD(P)H-dependent flavin oxidoreductase YrpB (nitropropane dioxygenase family)
MRSPFCEMFGLDIPLFAFSHCRDVVVEVSKAGGLGVLGVVGFAPDKLEEELRWIDREIGGKPYAVDLVIPARFMRGEANQELAVDTLWDLVPPGHGAFAHEVCDRYSVPPLGDSVEVVKTDELGWKESIAREQFETAMAHAPCASCRRWRPLRRCSASRDPSATTRARARWRRPRSGRWSDRSPKNDPSATSCRR